MTRGYDRHRRLRFDSGRDSEGTLEAVTLDRIVLPSLSEPLKRSRRPAEDRAGTNGFVSAAVPGTEGDQGLADRRNHW